MNITIYLFLLFFLLPSHLLLAENKDFIHNDSKHVQNVGAKEKKFRFNEENYLRLTTNHSFLKKLNL